MSYSGGDKWLWLSFQMLVAGGEKELLLTSFLYGVEFIFCLFFLLTCV